MPTGFRELRTPFVLVIALVFAGFVTQGCSESEQLPDADEAMRDARQAALKVKSYSFVFWTGFSEESEGVVAGTSEFHRPGIWVQRDSDGVLRGIMSGSTAYSLEQSGSWCKREIESEVDQDVLGRIPESLDRVTRVERSENGDLVIEGFAEDFRGQVNPEIPSINLYRLVIDSSSGLVVEWKWWVIFDGSQGDLFSMSTGELVAVADTRKEGPWDSFMFSNFDQLAPVGIPVFDVQECNFSAESGS